MPQTAQAFLSGVLYNPETKQADEAVVVVEFARIKARIRIDVSPSPIDAPNLLDQVPQLLREFGEALSHIPDVPLEPSATHRIRNQDRTW